MSAACFSDTPGAVTGATITGTVFIAHRLTQPLTVRCVSSIEATEFGLWKMTLRYDWDRDADHPAGSASLVTVLGRDGEGSGGDMYGVDQMPFLEPVVSGGPPG